MRICLITQINENNHGGTPQWPKLVAPGSVQAHWSQALGPAQWNCFKLLQHFIQYTLPIVFLPTHTNEFTCRHAKSNPGKWQKYRPRYPKEQRTHEPLTQTKVIQNSTQLHTTTSQPFLHYSSFLNFRSQRLPWILV